MSFLNPFFWLGLATLATPILVHLVRRTRARRVEFPTLRFVREVPRRTIRRRRLHNLLLLALRCLALLLVIIAFTRPYFNGSNTAEAMETERASLILLDTSFSMRYAERFAQAKQRAETIISEAREGEQMALVNFDQGYEILSRFTSDMGKLQATLKGVEVGWRGTDYEQALRGAESLFRDAGRSRLKRIFLISDFQATGWEADKASFRLPNNIRLVLIDVGENDAPNVAVTDVNARGVIYGQKYTDKLSARIANFSNEARQHLTIDFQINDQTVEKRDINIDAHDSMVVEFTGFNLSEGVNRCVITVKGDDFPLDNRFYFTLRREAQAKALIIETAQRGRSESLYLRHALTTGDNLPFELTVKSAGSVNPAEFGNYALIILNDAGNLNSALAESLEKFITAGGGLIIAAGPHSDAGGFNQSLQRITPASLGEVVQLPRGEGTAMSDVKVEHPIFEIFRDSGRLATARIFGYHRSEPRPTASVLARFEDGSPALIEAAIGAKGKVLLFTSTFDLAWTDLPFTPLYLPLVQQMARYLIVRESCAWHPLGQAFALSPTKEDALPAIDAPDGIRLPERALTTTGDLILNGRQPGFYRLRYPEQTDYAAVNLDGDESDLSKLNLDEFVAALTDSGNAQELSATESRAQLNNEEVEARQRMWWPLLMVALLLFVAEALLARRIKMAKVIG